MADLTISLTPEQQELINEKLASGAHRTATEVVAEALRLLQDQEVARRHRLDALRHEISKGIESLERGDVREFHSGEELAVHIEAEGRKLLAERKAHG